MGRRVLRLDALLLDLGSVDEAALLDQMERVRTETHVPLGSELKYSILWGRGRGTGPSRTG